MLELGTSHGQLNSSHDITKSLATVLNDALDDEIRRARDADATMAKDILQLQQDMKGQAELQQQIDELKAALEKVRSDGITYSPCTSGHTVTGVDTQAKRCTCVAWVAWHQSSKSG